MQIKNKRLTSDEFYAQREEVLLGWSTGAEVDLDEAIEYQKNIPSKKRFSYKLVQAQKLFNPLIQPRAGMPLLDEHIELLKYLQNEGGADLLPSNVDGYTTHNLYSEAEKGIEQAKLQGKSPVDGFPAVNHGVKGCRKIIESLDIPVQMRHSSPDARLLAEISFAGGFTSFEGGPISYVISHEKNASLEKSIHNWQYVDRLTAVYEEAGVVINREPFGPLTGTLVPPCISHAVAVIEAVAAAEQGVKNITVGYGQCGNLAQDVAAIRSLEALTTEYLEKLGYKGCTITTVFHQWMGGFPEDESQAYGVIAWGSSAGALAGASKIIVKSPKEAAFPTKEANAQGLRCSRQTINMVGKQRVGAKHVSDEISLIMRETRAILEKTTELGRGDIVLGAIKAVETGVIDVPFAANRINHGAMLPARDDEGAVRIMQFGNLPFDNDIKAFHQNKMEERARKENRQISFQMVIDDIYAVSRGRLVGRP